MESKLFEIFSDRPRRYCLLDKGLKVTGLLENKNELCKLLEIGCGYGDSSAYLAEQCNFDVIGADISAEKIEYAKKRHLKTIQSENLEFLLANSENMPFEENVFDIVFSEAAFSPTRNKKKAAEECYRTLKKGGYFLINDFSIKNSGNDIKRKEVDYIPCFSGVDTIINYIKILKETGFKVVSYSEEYGEFIGLAMWVSKQLKIRINDVGPYLSDYYNSGKEPACNTKTNDDTFFNKSNLTYCQLVLMK